MLAYEPNLSGFYDLAQHTFAFNPQDHHTFSQANLDRLEELADDLDGMWRLARGLGAALDNLLMVDSEQAIKIANRQKRAIEMRYALREPGEITLRPFAQVGAILPRHDGSNMMGVSEAIAARAVYQGIWRIRENSIIDPVAGFRYPGRRR